jgi:hypothetical protein
LVLRRNRRAQVARTEADTILQPIKCRLIDTAFQQLLPHSFADLGGVWAVEAGYTFYALDRYPVERAVLVDTGISPTVREKAATEPRLELLDAPFGSGEALQRVGQVDAVLLFDVLLHQVDPNWDDILRMYADHTKAFVILDPQWMGATTVRLLELGERDYHAAVPTSPVHDEAWQHLDEIHPVYGRPWRDIHEIWQWGVVEEDLRTVCEDLGFNLLYYENGGPWPGLTMFENRGFVYARPELLTGARSRSHDR